MSLVDGGLIIRTDGPLHDGVGIIDSLYDDGAWDTLAITDCAMTLVGYAPGYMELTQSDGSKEQVQGGLFLMVRHEHGYDMVLGGGI